MDYASLVWCCVEDRLEQDAVTWFVAAGADTNDPSTAEDISSRVYDVLFGFYWRERARDFGVCVLTTQHVHVGRRCFYRDHGSFSLVNDVGGSLSLRHEGSLPVWARLQRQACTESG